MSPSTPGSPNGSPLGDAVAHSFRKTISTLQKWECGSGADEPDILRVAFTDDDQHRLPHHVLQYDPLLNALNCTPEGGLKGSEYQCSDDFSESTEGDQMRRLSSWGTYGTLESVELNRDTRLFDDDGRPIDPIIMEKQRENRQKNSSTKPRLVKFAYPPVTSLKQCPRLDPEDIDHLFFTTQELDQYEEDRRQTNVVDDVEIVAVSTSSGSTDDEEELPPTNKFGRYIPSPTKHKNKKNNTAASSNQHSNAAVESAPTKKPKRKPVPSSPRSPHSVSPNKGKDSRRLLKSVQIFLRERSTAA